MYILKISKYLGIHTPASLINSLLHAIPYVTLYLTQTTYIFMLPGTMLYTADASGRAVYGESLLLLACKDCGLESSRGHGCLL